MKYEQAACSIHIGTGAGARLLEDIDAAEDSIRIVSPYMSASFAEKLITRYKAGIDVELYTMEDSKKALMPHIRKLLVEPKKKMSKTAKLLYVIGWILACCFVGGAGLLFLMGVGVLPVWGFLGDSGFTRSAQEAAELGGFLLAGLLPIIAYFMGYTWYKRRVRKHPDYQYTQLFPFTIFKPKGRALIHSKIYVIDNKVAYMGSLNFSENGTTRSHETQVRFDQYDVVQEIGQAIDELAATADWDQVDIQELAKGLE